MIVTPSRSIGSPKTRRTWAASAARPRTSGSSMPSSLPDTEYGSRRLRPRTRVRPGKCAGGRSAAPRRDKALQLGDIRGGQPGLLERAAAGPPDRRGQRSRPYVLDERDRGGRPGRNRVGQRPPARLVRLVGLAGTLLRGAAQQRGGEPAELRSELGRRGEGVERAVRAAGDEKQVHEPDDPGFAQPGELRQHLAGERRLLEPDDQHLHRPHHAVTRARSCSYSSALMTPESSRCRREASVSPGLDEGLGGGLGGVLRAGVGGRADRPAASTAVVTDWGGGPG